MDPVVSRNKMNVPRKQKSENKTASAHKEKQVSS